MRGVIIGRENNQIEVQPFQNHLNIIAIDNYAPAGLFDVGTTVKINFNSAENTFVTVEVDGYHIVGKFIEKDGENTK
jgi:hypothetical protein